MVGLVEGEGHVLGVVPLRGRAGIVPGDRDVLAQTRQPERAAHRAFHLAGRKSRHGGSRVELVRPAAVAEVLPVARVQVADLGAWDAPQVERGTAVPVAVVGNGVDVLVLVILARVAPVLAVFEEERGAKFRARPHRVVVVGLFVARPGAAPVGGLDQAHVVGGLPQVRVRGGSAVSVVFPVPVLRDEGVEDAVDAVSTRHFPV